MATINKINFYKKFQVLFGKATTSQIMGFESIINYWEKIGYSDLRWLAYIFATVWHETDKKMQPIEEYGKGEKRRYGKKIKHSGATYIVPNKIYYGRGFVQLTWYENYELMSRLIGIDILKNPELALGLDCSVKILFEGMTKGSSSFGDFTGKCLEMYFNSVNNDPVAARKIINGNDKAELIASHYHKFLNCL